MKIETINKLCCPFDKADLILTEIEKTASGDVLEGFFVEKPLLERWQKHLKGKAFENFRLASS